VFVFAPTGTHKVLLSGTQPQTIHFSPYVDNSSYAVAAFAHFETTNPHPLTAPYPISFDHMEDDLTFAGTLRLSSYGDLLAAGRHTIQADCIRLEEAACLQVVGDLTLEGDLSGGRVDIGAYEGSAARLTLRGDLSGTDLYYNTTAAPSIVEVTGNYRNDGADICLCNGRLLVRGDFRHQTLLEDGTYGPAPAPFASIYEGSEIEVEGDFVLQMAHLENFGLPQECAFRLKGDFLQICEEDTPDFWNHGISRLILAGEQAQTVNAPAFYFTDITLANLHPAGVTFDHALFGISGIFNAYGREDGTATPYRFPKGCAPAWKDWDEDGIPDPLDADPWTAASAEAVPAVLNNGVQEENAVRFLYAAVDETAMQETLVWLGLYTDGRLTQLRPAVLKVLPGQLQELEVDLSGQLGVDSVKIFQLQASSYSPRWTTADWCASN